MQIETERLVLRRPIQTDIDALIDIHADPEVEQFMDRYGRHVLNAKELHLGYYVIVAELLGP